MNFGVGDYQKVHYAPGCADTACEGGDLIPDAVAVASNADAVVLVVGLAQQQETESLDRTSLLLPGFQQDLISAVATYANGCAVVLVIMSAGPVDISVAKEDNRIQSIMWVGYPGEAGGQAIASIIFGYHNPGKLQFQQWSASTTKKLHQSTFSDSNVTCNN
jgi:beta-D-xylosidase 4